MNKTSRLWNVLAAALLACASNALPAVDAPATLARSSLLVGDADRSIAFYGLLGFRVESDTGRQGSGKDSNHYRH